MKNSLVNQKLLRLCVYLYTQNAQYCFIKVQYESINKKKQIIAIVFCGCVYANQIDFQSFTKIHTHFIIIAIKITSKYLFSCVPCRY